MDSEAGKAPHPLVWVAAILLIVVCGAGVAALMGWIPISLGTPAEPVLLKLERPAAPARAAVAARCVNCGVVRSVRKVATQKPVESAKSAKSYEITIDLNDGSDEVITFVSAPAWRHGDKVRIVNGFIESDA